MPVFRPFRKQSDPEPDGVMTFLDDDGAWNIAEVAEGVASVPSTYLDDLLVDEDGAVTTVDPKVSRTRAAAVRLGQAAAGKTMSSHLREAMHHHAEGVRLGGAYRSRAPMEASASSEAEDYNTLLAALRAAPMTTRPKHAKKLSLLAKPMFLLGDVAVIFNILNKSGSNVLAAVLTGVSAATGAVAAGTVAGHNAAVAYQRQRRGDMPDAVEKETPGLSDLYADPQRGELSWLIWVGVAAVFSVVLGFAVALITMAGGYPAEEALGGGLITALTVVGSFGAEAYGTNVAADRIEQFGEKRDAADVRCAEIGDLLAEADAELVTAETIRAIGSVEAPAVRDTTMVVTDAPKADERVRGYIAAESADDLAVSTESSVQPVAPPTITRTPPRIVGPLAATEDDTVSLESVDNGMDLDEQPACDDEGSTLEDFEIDLNAELDEHTLSNGHSTPETSTS